MSALTLSAPAFASNGGTAVPNTASGGVVYGQAVRKVPERPRVRRFAVERRRVLVRVDRRGARRVRVSMRLRRGQANHLLTRVIRTGRRVTIGLPKLRPGHWTVRMRVTGLQRIWRGRILVHGVHHKAPATPPTAPPPADGGVFPVAGWHLYGDGIGAKRKGHTHHFRPPCTALTPRTRDSGASPPSRTTQKRGLSPFPHDAIKGTDPSVAPCDWGVRPLGCVGAATPRVREAALLERAASDGTVGA